MFFRPTVQEETRLLQFLNLERITCLSVLDNGKVKHYKLRKLDNGHYFVSRTKSFETLKELVEHYSRQADGLCVRLGEPCKKVKHTELNRLCVFVFEFNY